MGCQIALSCVPISSPLPKLPQLLKIAIINPKNTYGLTKKFNEDCPWHQKLYQVNYPFIKKYDGNIKHCLIDYSK